MVVASTISDLSCGRDDSSGTVFGQQARSHSTSFVGAVGVADADLGLKVDSPRLQTEELFKRHLTAYLRQHGCLSPVGGIWDDMRASFAWSHTRAARRQQATLGAALTRYIDRGLMTLGPHRTLVDVGCGDGAVLTRNVGLLQNLDVGLGSVVAIDQSDDAVIQSVTACRKVAADAGLRVEGRTCRLEALDCELRPADVVLTATGVLHHLPVSGKAKLFAMLKRFCSQLVVTELLAPHDQTAASRLIVSVSSFYGAIIEDVEETHNLSRMARVACIERFLMPEALTMLISPYERRENYHMELGDWIAVAAHAGWECLEVATVEVCAGGPVSATMFFRC